MGGKNKGNRTKNNARPSSSAKAAEILGSNPPTFFGLGTFKDGTLLPTSAPEDIDVHVDVNFQLALKKMGKKDATTKLKALQEFTELCNKATETEVKAILPFWPRLYSQLCGVSEHRVREAAHYAHKAVIIKVKKQLAPYLKEIIGPWYSSQYDTYPPAASAAVAAFQEAFSPVKMAEAVTFCQEEILNYFYHNLIVHTPQTLSNPKTSTAEEMEDKYRRVVSSSLLAYSSYLQKITTEKVRSCEQANKNITSAAKFWKLGSNKDPIIRHAFLTALISLCQQAVWLVEEEHTKVAAAIFNNLSEDDPLVLPLVWDAVLHGVVAIPKCWNNNNVEKQMLPKLFEMLRSGGRGHANNILPKVLPLLSALPPSKIHDKTDFFTQLFSSMRQGLLDPSVNKSLSESKVVATTFVESFQYMIMINKDDSKIIEMLIKEQLITAIDSAWQYSTDALHTNLTLFTQIGFMLRAWHKNSASYEKTTAFFWHNLAGLFTEKLETPLPVEELKEILKNQTLFLTVLQCPERFASKVTGKVRFSVPDDKKVQKAKTFPTVSVPNFDKSLLDFAQKMAGHYVSGFTKSSDYHYLHALLDLAKFFDAKSIFDAVSQKVNLFELFSTSLEGIIPQNLIVILGLQMLPNLQEEFQVKIVEKLSDRLDIDLELLCRGLLSCNSPRIKNWMKSDTFSKIFLKLAEDFILGKSETVDDPLCGFLVPAPSISEPTLIKLIETIIENLETETMQLKNANIIIDTLRGQICKTTVFENLTIRLFTLSCAAKGEKYSHILRTVLMKMKIFTITGENSWEKLSRTLSSNVYDTNYDVERLTAVVQKLIEVSLDVDLTVASDGEEIKEAIPLVRIFLEPPSLVWKTGLFLMKRAQDGAELCGECSVHYLELKSINQSKGVKIDEDLMQFNEDPDAFLGYRQSHLDCRSSGFLAGCDELSGFSAGAVLAYISWLRMTNELLELLFSAYPTCSKLLDMDVPGRYVVGGSFKVLPEEVPPDIVSWNITQEEWEELDEMRRVNAELSSEDYPDDNLIVPLGNYVADLIQGVANVDVMLNLYPEMESYSEISKEFQPLQKSLPWTIATTTPKEFEFIYNLLKALVLKDSSWAAIHQQLIPILRRRFRSAGCKLKLTRESVDAILGDVTRGYKMSGSNGSILRLVAIVKDCAHWVTLDQWNDVFIQMDKVIRGLQKTDGSLTDDELREAAAVSSFFLATQNCFLNCLDRPDQDRLTPDLIKMWNDVVEKELWAQLFTTWRSLLPRWLPEDPNNDGSRANQVPLHLTVAVRRLCSAVIASPHLHVPEPMSDTLAFVEQLAQLLMSPNASLQVTAFRLLLSLVPELVEADAVTFQNQLSDDADEDKALFTRVRDCNWTIKRLSRALMTSQSVVEALLSGFEPGDTCTVEPYTDAFTYTHGYLLLCLFMLKMCEEAHVALRFQFGSWLSDNGHLHVLLHAVFKLMPASVVHGDTRDSSGLFENYGNLDINKAAASSWIEHRACFLYRQCLQWLPAAVRKWYAEEEHSVASIVAGATSSHVSPLLIQSELKAVQNASAKELDNITVAVSLVSREVIGSYVIDEASMQILISLPTNYPLGTIKVDFNTQTVIPKAWKISMFLIHRNGSIRDALALWKSDLDKRFDGVEECEICFAILNGPNFDLPSKSCHTCRKKFHSFCLFKWFNTSNKSSCPHCRNQF